jgi:lipoprotein-anchoring transpeptidase ErfK/SrfK
MVNKRVSRRDFLKLSGLGIGCLALRPLGVAKISSIFGAPLSGIPDFPSAKQLARVTKGMVEVKSHPDSNSPTIGVLYEDAVVPWLREIAGSTPSYVFNNQRWVETPEGYVYGPLLQPVKNLPNAPVSTLQQTSLGSGMWAEVTVPYVDVILQTEPTSNSWVEARVDEGLPVRLYYSQVFWVDQIKTDDSGKTLYRVNPNYYGGVDMLWAAAEAFRPISNAELEPINPQAEDKRIIVDVTYQTLSCYEESREVYFCRVSSGAKFDMFGNPVDAWATPLGQYRISVKYMSLQMSGGTTGAGYDLPGIGWTSIFATGGVAIHSTFWHNNYGDAMSHGCVNITPEDAKWIFRWSAPLVPYDPGMVDATQGGQPSTPVQVMES